MPDIPSPRISWQRCLLLFLIVLLLAAPQAALLPLIDRDEPRFAEAAREMVQSGDYVLPHFNNVPRYDKPPLIYWCEVAAYAIFGENAFAARLPSIVATAATAVLIYTWGARLGRMWIGLAAALSYSFCLQTMQQGRVATADALMIFFMTLTAFAGWQYLVLCHRFYDGGVPPTYHIRRTWICRSVLAIGFAGGFLAKGPEAWLPLVALLYCARQALPGTTRHILLSFFLSLALVLLWGVPAYFETSGDYLWHAWKAGIADRAWGSDQGHGASSIWIYLLELPYYFIGFWISALPWSVLIVLNARRLFAGWKLDLADTYLLFNVVPLWIIFTLMATKLPHYTLPTFPMIALLFARRWVAAELSPILPLRTAAIFGLAFALLAIIGVPLAMENGYSPSPVGKLVFAAGENLKPDTQFALVDFKEPTAVWEMRRVTKGYAQLISEDMFVSFLLQPGPRAVVISSDALKKYGIYSDAQHNFQIAGISDPDKYFTAQGFNAAKGKTIDLTMIVKP